MHCGTDLAAPVGTPIVATENGTVTFNGWQSGYGLTLEMKHGGGYTTRHGHCSRILVRNGQSVVRGQTIALVGNTGHSTGPHLHFEIRRFGVLLNPVQQFVASRY
jgi:murein DD-endopeptidase MepM/ murein hydrolase activator NlpD